jgi:protein TonB
MDPSSFGTVSFATTASVAAEMDRSRPCLAPPAERATTRPLHAALFCASLVLHVALLVRLQTSHQEGPRGIRKASQVEIQITQPPTPVVVPPQVERPPPPATPVRSPHPQPRLSLPEPVHAAAAAHSGEVGLDAPAGDEGEAPRGTGDVAAPVVQAAPLAPPPPAPAPVIEAREGANYLKNPRPAYPHVAQREGWEGSVLLRVRVLPTGHPDTIAVQRSSGHGVLDQAAVEVVKGWAFTPATQGGVAIAGWVNVPIEFRLQ